MMDDLFQGRLVRLKAVEPESMAEAFSRWSQDTEYWRLMAGEPAQPMAVKSTRAWLEDELYQDPPAFIMFAIHSLEDDRLIGEIGFEDDDLPAGETFLSVGIGEREYWGKGYGTDALMVILRYAFTELNLERVSLTVSEYNPRAIQSYRKAGFVEEGRLRGSERRGGRRYDTVYMGLLRAEWEDQQASHRAGQTGGEHA
jgi:RimJ/RimL family protein N-acetyltransferase